MKLRNGSRETNALFNDIGSATIYFTAQPIDSRCTYLPLGNRPMPFRDIVVIGASSGGIDALGKLFNSLPHDVQASFLVVQHIASHSINRLPHILQRETAVSVQTATDGARMERGQAYVAPADHHLIIDREQMFLSKGPRENRTRPAIDPLFRSAALSHGPRVIGVVLSGSLDDGTAGLGAIKKSGGIAVVQDPQDALTPDMPQSALDHVEIDHCVPVDQMGPLLQELTAQEFTDGVGSHDEAHRTALQREVDVIRRESGEISTATRLGELVPASCPDCGGPLWEVEDEVPRFRCHTGHAFTARHLVAGLEEAEETSLWVALRVMEERVRMLQRMAKRDSERGSAHSEQIFAEKATEAEEHVRRIRGLLHSSSSASETE